jgi:hypothetical protein
MANGALMQLVAVGAQDKFITVGGNVTFWVIKYARYTNFAMESMRQVLSGRPNFGNKVTAKISRNGDLMGACYVQATLPDPSGETYCNAVGFRLLKETQLRIGGQLIDKQSSNWLLCWNELSSPVEKQLNSDTNLTSTLSRLVGLKSADGAAAAAMVASGNTWRVNVPLQFAFCRHPGLALPLIALQYHEVEVSIELATKNEVLQNGTGGTNLSDLSDVALYVDYIFLDTEERQSFAQKPQQYIIETVQEQSQSITGTTTNVRLNFNHPVKELVWAIRDGSGARDVFTDFLVASSQAHPVTSATLKLNGTERFSSRPGLYFSGVQPYQHHEGNPDNGICCYSFALRPEELQPSGTCNFSRIDNAELSVTTDSNLTANTSVIVVMANSYNVLRVAGGMAGLAYSN